MTSDYVTKWASNSPCVREVAADSAVGGRFYPAPTWVPERKYFIIRVGGANTSIWASTGVDSGKAPAATWKDARLSGRVCHDLFQGTLETEGRIRDRRIRDGRLVDLDLKLIRQAEPDLIVIADGDEPGLD